MSVKVITALVKDYVALSADGCFAEKRAFWDRDEPNPLLWPEEADLPISGREAMDRYWNETGGMLQGLKTVAWDIHVHCLGDHAVAGYTHRWQGRLVGMEALLPRAIASSVRVTMALRRKPEGWRVFALIEGHVDGAVYFRDLARRLAQSAASPPSTGITAPAT